MGRSGTFICIHAQQDRMKTEAVIDIFHYIKSIRIQRAGLVADLVSHNRLLLQQLKFAAMRIRGR